MDTLYAHIGFDPYKGIVCTISNNVIEMGGNAKLDCLGKSCS